jgi:hypothetical protein
MDENYEILQNTPATATFSMKNSIGNGTIAENSDGSAGKYQGDLGESTANASPDSMKQLKNVANEASKEARPNKKRTLVGSPSKQSKFSPCKKILSANSHEVVAEEENPSNEGTDEQPSAIEEQKFDESHARVDSDVTLSDGDETLVVCPNCESKIDKGVSECDACQAKH